MPRNIKHRAVSLLPFLFIAACQAAPTLSPTTTTTPSVQPGPPAATPGPLQLTATAAPVGTLYDLANQFSIVPADGWQVRLADPAGALSSAATTLANYDLSVDPTEAPLDGVQMDLITYQRPAGVSFGQFVLGRRGLVDTGEAGAPLGTALTDLEFLTVGDYGGIQYLQIPPHADTWWLIYLDGGESGRVLAAAIHPATRPEGQAQVAAAMHMLNTVVILSAAP